MSSRPGTFAQVLFDRNESEHGESVHEMHKLACRLGYEFFHYEGSIFRCFSDGPNDFDSIGRLEQIFPPTETRVSVVELPRVLVHKDHIDSPYAFPELLVLDNFYANPDAVRMFALSQNLESNPEFYQGHRSASQPIGDDVWQVLMRLFGRGKVGKGYCAWQLNVGGEKLVYHSDHQRFAGAVYLTPNPPPGAGTSFWRSATTRVRSSEELPKLVDGATVKTTQEAETMVYGGALLDRTRWQEVDRIGNVYNRLVVWDARLIHSVSEYFGHELETGRLVQLFFWDWS